MKPLAAVALFIRCGNRVLLQLRSKTNPHAPGAWGSGVGGKIEMGESFRRACERETLEEIGPDIRFNNLKYWTTINTIYPTENKHFVVVCFVANYVGGDVINKEPAKHEKFGWFEWDNLPSNIMQGLKYLKDNGFTPFSITDGFHWL